MSELERLRLWGQERHMEACRLMSAAWHFKYPIDPTTLELIAEEIDCGSSCDFSTYDFSTNATECPEDERPHPSSPLGCRANRAAELRDLARAIRQQGWALALEETPFAAGTLKAAQ